MVSLSVNVYRGKLVESKHQVISLVKNTNGKILLTTHNENELVYPRSSIKIFQALPFINSNAHIKYKLNEKNIAIACSSHKGEVQHLNVLNKWVNKINIHVKDLKCGIHNPIDLPSSNNLLLSGKTPTQLHNNCAGKHLAMISGCLAYNMKYKNYIDFYHPYQKLIRQTLEIFMESKIQKNCIGIDGCSVPQYAFKIKHLSNSMINLIIEKNNNNEYSKSINTILSSINKFPELIGGHDSFDSEVIKITKGRIFCKGGAEGVLLFADFTKKVGGVIKILDGNDRARPAITMRIFSQLNLLSGKEKKLLKHWAIEQIYNHNKKNVGQIKAILD